MQTSQAATVITTSARICPSPLPHMREKAISARLPPLSISSRHSSTTSGLRRVITPTAPSAKTIAETARYQAMLMTAARRLPSAIVPVPCGAQQVQRRQHLGLGSPRRGRRAGARARRRRRRRSAAGTRRSRTRAGSASAAACRCTRACRRSSGRGRSRRPAREIASRPVPSSAINSSTSERAAEHRAAERAARRRPGRWPRRRSPIESLVADVGDDEHVQHHHRAGVDDDLHRGDEFRAQQQEQHGQRDEVADEREHAVERVAQQRPRRSRRRSRRSRR